MKKLLLCLIAVLCIKIMHAQQVTLHNPEVVPLTFEGLSIPLSQAPEWIPTAEDLNMPPVERGESPSEENPIPVQFNPNAQPKGADPALQTDYSNLRTTSATVLSNWAGLANANVNPSDNNIAVGPNDVVQMCNNSTSTSIRIWDKTGTVLVSNKLVKTITNVNDCGDPNILYDQQADRFVLVVLYSCSLSNKKLIICVSQTNDPTGSWYVYSLKFNNGFPDYPKIGVWGNSYFITTNSTTPTVWALDRTKMLAGSAFTTVQKFTMTNLPTINIEAPSPVVVTGTQTPTGPALMMRYTDDGWGSSIPNDHLEIYKVTIDWTNSANSTMTGPTNLVTNSINTSLCGSYNTQKCIPQSGSTTKLDPLLHFLMDKVKYRKFSDHESIVCSCTCNADGNGTAGIRWYELRTDVNGNWYIYQQSTYQPDAAYRFMPSITINDDNSIALGFNKSSSTTDPSQSFTGRADADALGSMTISELTPVAGSHANGSYRYGDYNGMVTDPSDNSFWLTTNYNSASSWSTSVCHFTITHQLGPQAPANVIANNVTTHSVELSWTGFQTPLYQIRYRTFGSNVWTSATTTSLSDFVVNGLMPDTKYEFSVGGKAGPQTFYSADVTATTLATDVAKSENSIPADLQLSLVPVPATDNVQISFNCSEDANAAIQIYNMNGQNVYQQNFFAPQGINVTRADVHDLANGYYLVQVRTDCGTATQKLVVQH